jgi:hypothetical protein
MWFDAGSKPVHAVPRWIMSLLWSLVNRLGLRFYKHAAPTELPSPPSSIGVYSCPFVVSNRLGEDLGAFSAPDSAGVPNISRSALE